MHPILNLHTGSTTSIFNHTLKTTHEQAINTNDTEATTYVDDTTVNNPTPVELRLPTLRTGSRPIASCFRLAGKVLNATHPVCHNCV